MGFVTQTILAAEVIRHFSHPLISLPKRLQFATSYALKKTEYKNAWIIYQVSVPHSEPNLNQYSADDGFHTRTLAEIIFSRKPAPKQCINHEPSRQIIALLKNPNKHLSNKATLEKHSHLAIILDCYLESGRPRIFRIYHQPMNSVFTKEDRPIFWLGDVDTGMSFHSLANLFQKTRYEKLRKQILDALAQHGQEEMFAKFVKSIFKPSICLGLKMEAIQKLGKIKTKTGIKFLVNTAISASNFMLRKISVQALSHNHHPLSRKAIRILALKGNPVEVRKEAIFGLSQIGDEESIYTLGKIVAQENNPDIKEYAIFAISQLPDNKGKPLLAKLAKLSPNPKIREKAIFWMGKTDEEKRLDLLIDVINGLDN